MTCEQCGFENDSTRVFCQNCGTRLPASAAATPGELFIPSGQQAPESVRKPIKPVRVARESQPRSSGKKFNPLGGLFTALVAGAWLAACIEMARPPDGIPPVMPANDTAAQALYDTADACLMNVFPRAMTLTPNQVNGYLASRIVAGNNASAPAYVPRFVRAYMTFGNGDYQIVMEEKIFDWPIYIALTQAPTSQKPLRIQSTGGAIGRLPIHPFLLPIVERLVTPMVNALTEVCSILSKASTATLTPAQASISWPGSKNVAP